MAETLSSLSLCFHHQSSAHRIPGVDLCLLNDWEWGWVFDMLSVRGLRDLQVETPAKLLAVCDRAQDVTLGWRHGREWGHQLKVSRAWMALSTFWARKFLLGAVLCIEECLAAFLNSLDVRNTLKQIPRTMFDQMSRHPWLNQLDI